MAMQVKANVKQISSSASEGTARDHAVYCDRPEAKGGSNKGAMGGELLLMGLGGCFMSNLLAVGQARETDVSEINVELDATLEESPPHFSAVALTIAGNYPDRETMQKLVTMAEHGCIAANTLKNSVKLNFIIK